MKNASKVTFVILGAIIGAGFISGQEINLFFNKYNENGIIGILFSGILIGIIINKTYKIIYTEKINTYEDLIKQRDRWARGNLQVLKHYKKEIFSKLKFIFVFNIKINIEIIIIGINN